MKLSITSTDLRRPHAFVFDLDGTLIDSRADIAAACNHALATEGLPPLDDDAIAGFVGDGARMLLARALARSLGGPADADRVERAAAAYAAYYEANPARHTRLMPGARELLDALGDRPAAICTNKPRGATLAVLETLGVAARFLAVRCAGDGPLKPDPAPIRDVLRAMRVDASQAWMVGDGAQDVLAGRAAGCLTVAIRGGFASEATLVDARPDFLLDSLLDLIALVRT